MNPSNPVAKQILETNLNLTADDLDDDALNFLQARLLKLDFYEFMKYFWCEMDPTCDYIEAWWTKALCEHVQAAYERKIKRLMICMPPGHGKTFTVRIGSPAWRWMTDPSERIMSVSYKHEFTKEHAKLLRDLIVRPRYTSILGYIPDVADWKLKKDANQIENFKNTESGQHMAFSLSGITGAGAQVQLIDDLMSMSMANSDVERSNVIEFYRSTMMSRIRRWESGVKILINQRAHVLDLTGWLMEDNFEGWEILNLQAIYEPKILTYPSNTSLNFTDPRKEGEALCDELASKEYLAQIRKAQGDYHYLAQYQQEPILREGGILKRKYFTPITVDDLKQCKVTNTFLSIDPAFSGRDKINSDYTAWVRLAIYQEPFEDEDGTTGYEQKICILGCGWDRVEFDAFHQWLHAYDREHAPQAIIIEKTGAGNSLYQSLQRKYEGRIHGFDAKKYGDKPQRVASAGLALSATPCSYLHDEGNEMSEKIEDGIDWMLKYTGVGSSHDDLVDSFAQGILWAEERRLIRHSMDFDATEYLPTSVAQRKSKRDRIYSGY